jgi:glutathione S-transferase
LERSIPLGLEWVDDPERTEGLSLLGRTPILVTDQTPPLHDVAAILEYLDAQHDGMPLFPSEQRWIALDHLALCRDLIEIISRRNEELHRSSAKSRAVEDLEAAIWRTLAWLDEHIATFSPLAGTMSADQIAVACALDYTDFSYSLHWHLTFSGASRWLGEAHKRESMAETKLVRGASARVGP